MYIYIYIYIYIHIYTYIPCTRDLTTSAGHATAHPRVVHKPPLMKGPVIKGATVISTRPAAPIA